MSQQRPLWIVIFALMVAAVAIRLKADEPVTLDDVPAGREIVPSSGDATTQVVLNGEVHELPKHVPRSPSPRVGRPKSVGVRASLSNFDADADPDGWMAEVVLLDASGNRVTRRATARFKLNPRIPTQDYTGYVTAKTTSATWSMNLSFDADGIARVRLPLNHRLRPVFGWRASPHQSVGLEGGSRSVNGGILRSAATRHVIRSGLSPSDLYGASVSSLGLPSHGVLNLTVSVPTEGVFRASAPIELRPSVLVDTRWPYQ
ncbi:MAG: hypothetical protein AAFX06_29730 [Planctomycetota bacterium]